MIRPKSYCFLFAGLLVCLDPPDLEAAWRRFKFGAGGPGATLGGNVPAGGFFGAAESMEFSLYHQRYGLGLGTRVFEIKGRTEGWRVDRAAGPAADGHYLSSLLPVSAYMTLYSRQGIPDRANLRHTIGRLELYVDYAPLGSLWNLSEKRVSASGDETRAKVKGSLDAPYVDYGLRVDAGSWWAVDVGRLEMRTRAKDGFLSTYSSQWYLLGRLYFGWTWGDSVGGGVGLLVSDSWRWLRRHVLRRGPSIEE